MVVNKTQQQTSGILFNIILENWQELFSLQSVTDVVVAVVTGAVTGSSTVRLVTWGDELWEKQGDMDGELANGAPQMLESRTRKR